MEQPYFLSLDEVLQIHRSMIENYGGGLGIHDQGMLHSAIAMPQATFDGQFLHRDLFEMAASYLFHLAKDHAFVDGNKRVGSASAIIFLSMNDVEIEADEDGLVDLTLGVCSGEINKEQVTQFFRDRVLKG